MEFKFTSFSFPTSVFLKFIASLGVLCTLATSFEVVGAQVYDPCCPRSHSDHIYEVKQYPVFEFLENPVCMYVHACSSSESSKAPLLVKNARGGNGKVKSKI